MCSPDTIRLYKRFLALGVLCACFAVVHSPAVTETVMAAGCIEECMSTEAQCYDNCADECSSTDSSCGSCISTCATQFNSCTMGKVICAGSSGGGNTYSPECEVYFGVHRSNGEEHEGYFQVCRSSVGGQQCIKCPVGETCAGDGYSGGLNTCF